MLNELNRGQKNISYWLMKKFQNVLPNELRQTLNLKESIGRHSRKMRGLAPLDRQVGDNRFSPRILIFPIEFSVRKA
jgi:hypothetical protein